MPDMIERRSEQLTQQEISWMKALVDSTTATRIKLLSGEAPTEQELFTLINRAVRF